MIKIYQTHHEEVGIKHNSDTACTHITHITHFTHIKYPHKHTLLRWVVTLNQSIFGVQRHEITTQKPKD